MEKNVERYIKTDLEVEARQITVRKLRNIELERVRETMRERFPPTLVSFS